MPESPEFVGRITPLLKKGWLRPVGTQVMIVSAVLLLAAILLLGVNYNHLRHSYQLDEETDAALAMIDRTESKLVGVEMTLRGYALTHHPEFLQWRQRERQDLEDMLDELAAALVDEPAQKSIFAETRSLIIKRIALYDYLATPEHAAEVGHVIIDPIRREEMNQVRGKLTEMRRIQRTLKTERQNAMSQEARDTAALTGGIVILAFLSVVLGIIMVLSGGRTDTPPRLGDN